MGWLAEVPKPGVVIFLVKAKASMFGSVSQFGAFGAHPPSLKEGQNHTKSQLGRATETHG